MISKICDFHGKCLFRRFAAEQELSIFRFRDKHKKKTMQHTLQQKTRTKLRLGEVERLIKAHKIIVPAPCRSTLVKLCENGTFETVGDRPTSFGWLVYEDSFWKWVGEMDEG